MAEIKKAAIEKGHQVTGKVAILYGNVKAVSPDGTVRILKINSPVFADDQIITGDNASVSIVFDTANPVQLDLGRMSNMVIDEDVYGTASPDASTEAAAEKDAIQAALLSGEQPIVLDATAAGAEASSGGGHPVFVVTPDWAEVTPESGAETQGISFGAIGLNDYDPEQPINTIPTVNVNPLADGQPDVVSESGLAGGSDAAANTEFAYGSFTISDPDGLGDIQSVTINGTTVAIGSLAGNVIHGTNGDLTITSYDPATGVANYTYELKTPATDAPAVPETDVFSLTVSDGTGTSAPATITITINDDVPTAKIDGNGILEDATSPVTGDVLANDTVGADTPAVFVGWASTAATYGTFTDTGNGTYSYTLNNGNVAVQALEAGETLTETFTYTMADKDGDQSTSTLTITITGTNDTPTVNVNPLADGQPDVVSESGLAGGSSPSVAATQASGTFTISDPDGLGDVESVTINGTTIPIASLGTGNVISGTNGDLTITSYDPATGVANYTYELKTPATDAPAVTETDVFSLTVSDGTGTSAPATITIEIVDDMPKLTVAADSLTVDEDGLTGHAQDGTPLNTGEVTGTGSASATGNLIDNFNFGADGPATTPIYSINSINGHTAGADGHIVINETGYILDVDVVTGNYTFTLTDNLIHDPIQGENLQALLANGIDLNVVAQDGDGDQVSGTVTLNVNVLDDMPTAGDQNVTVDASTSVGSNLLIILDNSGSMAENSGVDGLTRLELAKNAIEQLINEYDGHGDVMVRIVTFNTTADDVGEHWMTANDAITALESITANGSTNYDAALASAIEAFHDPGAIPGGQFVSYFLSDGEPNRPIGSVGISDSETTVWEHFLAEHDVTSYALGMGTDVSATSLAPIAYDGVNETQIDPIVVTDLSQLDNTLIDTVINPGTATGNLITGSSDVSFGADGPADLKIVSIAHDTNGDGSIDSTEIYNTSSSYYDSASNTLNITTHEGGTLAVNFATGDYTYTSPSTPPLASSEVFTYIIMDGDGDTASATLTVNLPADNMLVVGRNVNDSILQTVHHYIDHTPPYDGPITGGGGNDVLVGDIGGSKIMGKSLNLSLVLDTSGSMTESITFNGTTMTRLEALKISVNNTLTDLANGPAENVRVQIVDFSTNSSQLGIYDLKAGELQAAINAINNLHAGGGTNYEAGLQEALSWANSIGVHAPLTGENVISQVIFISDGEPTYYYKDDADSPGLFNSNLGGTGKVFDQLRWITYFPLPMTATQ